MLEHTVFVHVYSVVFPPITNSRKLAIKWSGPLIINRFVNDTMIEIKEICVKKPRVYLAHHTKLWLAKCNGMKDINPSFFLPRISLKNAGPMENALSTVVLSAKPDRRRKRHKDPCTQRRQGVYKTKSLLTHNRKKEMLRMSFVP